ncbi:MAG: hypothetical protein ABI600_20335 [Luteolibacter sp.]
MEKRPPDQNFRFANIPEKLPFLVGGMPLLPEITPRKAAQEIEDRKGEAKRITKRLLAIIADHHSSADHIGVALDQRMLLKVAASLEAEARNEDPGPLLHDDDEVLAYLMRALYEELLEEPSNILFTTQVNPDTVRYEAMEVSFWQECLVELRRQLEGNSAQPGER